jgi:hypothetical protein
MCLCVYVCAHVCELLFWGRALFLQSRSPNLVPC